MKEIQINSMVLARVRRLCFIECGSPEEFARRYGRSVAEEDDEESEVVVLN